MIEGEFLMRGFKDYFKCDACGNMEFRRIYCFGFSFQKVNFSDGLIYNRLNEEKYQCTSCNKNFTKAEIENGMADLRAKNKNHLED
jgi:hypothetical protein